jgi:predicted lipid carrier protein YhbT
MPAPGRATLPALVSLLIRPAPLWPLEKLLSALTMRIAARNPAMFGRLGEHAQKTFAIAPSDLPFAFVLRPRPDRIELNVVRTVSGIGIDASIHGPLLALVALAEGSADGDALFFSREVIVEGDVGAVLALRNAIDDARLDITAELAAPLGPFAAPARTLLRAAAERMTAGAAWRAAAASWS